jgi:hypothetical protein
MTTDATTIVCCLTCGHEIGAAAGPAGAEIMASRYLAFRPTHRLALAVVDSQTATFASVLADARRHTDAYGGLAWEC